MDYYSYIEKLEQVIVSALEGNNSSMDDHLDKITNDPEMKEWIRMNEIGRVEGLIEASKRIHNLLHINGLDSLIEQGRENKCQE